MGIEEFFYNPGFIHIGEFIALFLDGHSLIQCRRVMSIFKHFIDNQRVLLLKQLEYTIDQKFRWLQKEYGPPFFHQESHEEEKYIWEKFCEQNWEHIFKFISSNCDIGTFKELVEIMRESCHTTDDPFTFAVKTGRWRFANFLLTNTSFVVYVRDHKRRTPFQLACKYGMFEHIPLTTEFLNDNGIPYWELKFVFASICSSGWLNSVKAILKVYDEYDFLLFNNFKAAFKSKNSDLIDLLFDYFIKKDHLEWSFWDSEHPEFYEPNNQNFKLEKSSLLHEACSYGTFEVAKSMLVLFQNKGIITCKADGEGMTPLGRACQRKDSSQIAELFLKISASNTFHEYPDIYCKTPLDYACLNGHVNIVKHFLNFKQNVFSHAGAKTILHFAVEGEQIEIAKLLIKNHEFISFLHISIYIKRCVCP